METVIICICIIIIMVYLNNTSDTYTSNNRQNIYNRQNVCGNRRDNILNISDNNDDVKPMNDLYNDQYIKHNPTPNKKIQNEWLSINSSNLNENELSGSYPADIEILPIYLQKKDRHNKKYDNISYLKYSTCNDQFIDDGYYN